MCYWKCFSICNPNFLTYCLTDGSSYCRTYVGSYGISNGWPHIWTNRNAKYWPDGVAY